MRDAGGSGTHRGTRRHRGAVLAAVLALVVALTAVVAYAARDDDTAPSPATTTAAPTPALLPTSCASAEELVPRTAMRCDLVPYVAGRPTVVLWGDSHAWQLVPALQEAVAGSPAGSPVNLVAFLFGSCPLMDGRAIPTECGRTNRLALDFVRRATRDGVPVRIVASEAWELYSSALDPDRAGALPLSQTILRAAPRAQARTARLFSALGRLGVPTDVVAPMPVVPTDVTGCVDLAVGEPVACDLPREVALADEDTNRAGIERLMRSLAGDSTLVDPSGGVCDADDCAALIDGQAVFYDHIHVSAEVSRMLAGYFQTTVERVAAA